MVRENKFSKHTGKFRLVNFTKKAIYALFASIGKYAVYNSIMKNSTNDWVKILDSPTK